MKELPGSQKRIIQELGSSNGRKFSELSKKLEMNDKTLFTGLTVLKKSGHVEKRKDSLWYLYETKNKTIIKFKKSQLMNLDLKQALEELKEYKKPFELGHILLQSVFMTLQQLNLEQHKVKVSDADKSQIQDIIDFCNKVIKNVFEVLKNINEDQTEVLSNSLNIALTPFSNLCIPKTLKPKEKKLADNLMKQLSPYVDDAIKRIKD